MSHIYIHVPFCKAKCAYCDFYSIPSLKKQDLYVEALLKEIESRKNEIDKPVDTIYFGGGTPSLLTKNNISKILDFLKNNFEINKDAEITLEANPENICSENCEHWLKNGINRLSIGIQSFNDDDLKYLRRRHDGKTALQAIICSQNAGFSNISTDFIHGIPNSENKTIAENIQTVANLHIPHISLYSLTLEEGSILEKLINSGKTDAIDEDKQYEQSIIAIEEAKKQGYIHYEISNFCLKNRESIHNSAYWQGEKYSGFGPAAHSFNINTRRWNIANIDKYIDAINQNSIFYESEIIGEKETYNEFLLTRLRTQKGFSIEEFIKLFGENKYKNFIVSISKSDNWKITEDNISLNKKGYFFADRIISDLMEV